MKKFIVGVIVGLLIPVIGGYFYIKMGMMPVATASAPLPNGREDRAHGPAGAHGEG